MLIHLNGLRYPWDYLRLLKYSSHKQESIAIQSVVVTPEYWDTSVGVLLYAEMRRRQRLPVGRPVPDRRGGHRHLAAGPPHGENIYKRYRFYEKEV